MGNAPERRLREFVSHLSRACALTAGDVEEAEREDCDEERRRTVKVDQEVRVCACFCVCVHVGVCALANHAAAVLLHAPPHPFWRRELTEVAPCSVQGLDALRASMRRPPAPYLSDPMLRPARSYELPLLASLLVRASVALNRVLGLPLRPASACTLQLRRRRSSSSSGGGGAGPDEAVSDTEDSEHVPLQPQLPLRQRLVLRAHNAIAASRVRVNLRPLADLRTLAWVVAAVLIARLAAVSAEAALLVALLVALALAVVAAVAAA